MSTLHQTLEPTQDDEHPSWMKSVQCQLVAESTLVENKRNEFISSLARFGSIEVKSEVASDIHEESGLRWYRTGADTLRNKMTVKTSIQDKKPKLKSILLQVLDCVSRVRKLSLNRHESGRNCTSKNTTGKIEYPIHYPHCSDACAWTSMRCLGPILEHDAGEIQIRPCKRGDRSESHKVNHTKMAEKLADCYRGKPRFDPPLPPKHLRNSTTDDRALGAASLVFRTTAAVP
jgi:hypothetical protein